MAVKLYNLARVLSTTTGTGTITLGPSVQGFLTFAQAGVPNGQEVSYGIRDGANSEVGTGVYSSIGPTLTRATVTNSTNLGAYINLSGSEEVYITARAEDFAIGTVTGAAPFADAMAYSGMQINGGMEVSQEKGAAVTTVSGQYVCDGWQDSFAGTMRIDAGIASGGVPSGFSSSLYGVSNVAQTSLAAGDFAFMNHKIEGYRLARLAWGTASAQPITLCFWSGHNRGGLYGGSLRNAGGTRSYAFSYTQAAGVYQYNIITIPGCTDGTWNTTNGVGIELSFTAASGTTYIAPSANAWLAGGYITVPGHVNAVAATSDTFRLTGVTVLPGTQAPTAVQSPNIMRPYDQELVTCQRYWRKTINAVGIGISGSSVRFSTSHPGMRAVPTLFNTGAISITDIYAANSTQINYADLSIFTATQDHGQYDLNTFSGLTVGRTYFILPGGNQLTLNARL